MPSNRFAGAGSRRKQRPPASGGGHTIVSPSTILGALYHSDFRADDPFRVMDGSNVAALYNYGLDASDALQGTAGKRPAYGAASLHGGPGVTVNDLDDVLVATFNTPIASSKRPYLWVVLKDDAQGGRFRVGGYTPGSDQRLLAYVAGAGDQWAGHRYNGSAFTTTLSGVGSNLGAVHLLEIGFPVGGTACFVFDGAAQDDTALALAASLTTLCIGDVRQTGMDGGGPTARVILASDQPSTLQIAAMRTYLQGANFPNYTGGAYV